MSAFGDSIKQRALRVRPTPAIEKYISKAFGHYVRIQILWILNERVASPSELAEELSEPLNRISGHIKVLMESSCIELVDQVIVGSAVQSFYRATARIFFDDTEWRTIPPTLKEGLRITLLQNLIDDAIAALEDETYDSLEGSHMSWTPMLIDEKARVEINELLDETLKKVLAIQQRAGKRLGTSSETGISYSVSLLGYPSIGGIKKVNPPKSGKGAPAVEKAKAKAAEAKRRKAEKQRRSGSTKKKGRKVD
jgi:DNA-binding transcriptional ArsR family regulator